MAVLHAHLGAVSGHGRCFAPERLKSAALEMQGNRSSGSSQSTGSAVFSGGPTPLHPFVMCCQDWFGSYKARGIADKGLALMGHYLGDDRKVQNCICFSLLVLASGLRIQ